MGNKISLSPGFCILGAISLLVLPIRWGMGAVLAIFIHELFHCAAICICDGKILSFSLGGRGAVIVAEPLSRGKEAFCALAGPLGSFSMLLLSERFPEAAVCGLIQGCFNLLPIYPLDGGRILRCLLSEPAAKGAEAFSLTLFTGIGLWLTIRGGEVGLIFLLALWIPLVRRKLSCKEAQ